MSKKGFTLIELLVVIAVLAVLAAGVVVAINPGKRINQAKDAKIRNDIGQIATALQAYYTAKLTYPSRYDPLYLGVLVASGDLKQVPNPPTPPGGGSSYYSLMSAPGGCLGTLPSPCTDVTLSIRLLDPAVAGNVWCWRSSTGRAEERADCPM